MVMKPPHNIADMRRQRERIRRITIGALLITVLAILGSCDGLVHRDAGALSPAAAARSAAPSGDGLSYASQARSPTDRYRPHP